MHRLTAGCWVDIRPLLTPKTILRETCSTFLCGRLGECYDIPCLQPTVKHGRGSVSFWGCISAFSVGKLVKIIWTPTIEKHTKVLHHHAGPRGNSLIGRGFIFQQDTDPKHTSNRVKQYLENKVTAGVLQVLELQAQSPDMSPIEAMWDYLLKTEENKRNQNNLTEKCGMYYRISGP